MISYKNYFLSLITYLLSLILLVSGDTLAEQSAKNPEITGINIKEAGSFTEIEIDSNSPFIYTIYKPSDPYRAVVELHNTGLGRFRETMVIDRAGVMEIIPSEVHGSSKTTRLEITLTTPAEIKPLQRGSALILAFPNPEALTASMKEDSLRSNKPVAEKPVLPLQVEEPLKEKVIGTPKTDVTPPGGKYTGERISLDFQDAELLHIFRLLADVSGYNIVVSPEVKGKISIKLLNVPWDHALDIILRNYGLSKVVEENVIRIAPTAVLAREAEDIAKAREAEIKAGDVETRVYPINYADVDKVKSAIETAKVLTGIGFISADKRTSTVIIKDVKERHKEYERLIKSLDLPTPQVNIEAKIVEVTTSFVRELGIQWGILWNPPDSRMRIGGFSGAGGAGGTGFYSGSPLMVNLPAAVGAGSGGAIGLGYISAARTLTLDIQLSAMESSGQGKIISNPRVTTADNEKATIRQGKRIPYQTVSAEGTRTEFVDATLELTVTPHVTPDGTIVMTVEAKKNEADFGMTVGGVPTINTQETKTHVLIKDGDTLVIGGIFKTTTSKSVAAVPGLSKIPILGRLFKKERDEDNISELLIFMTPRVVK